MEIRVGTSGVKKYFANPIKERREGKVILQKTADLQTYGSNPPRIAGFCDNYVRTAPPSG
jgi:hypothetical protein